MKNTATLILAVVSFLAAFGGYAFLMTRINTSIDSIAAAKINIDSIGKREGLAKAARIFLADTEDDRQALAQFVLDDQRIIEIIETIENTARREKVDASISSVTIQEEKTWNSHELARIAINGEGKYPSLAAFASALETLPFAARLESASFESRAKGTWFGSYTVVAVKEKSI